MAINNKPLYDAAYGGFLGGAFEGRYITDPVAAHYAGIKAAAIAFATEVDAQIGAGSPSIEEQVLMQTLCQGVMSGMFNPDAVAGDYAIVAAAIAALYTE